MTDMTFAGNLAADPQLSFTASGIAVTEFKVIESRSTKNEADEWVDAEPNVFNVTAWRSLAEHVGESVAKGDRVIVTGRLVTERFHDRETGKARTSTHVVADEVGFSLKYHTVKGTKAPKRTAG